MNGYQQSLVLDASPAKVYAALTTPEGLRGWWTQDCDIATEVGGTSEFRFQHIRKQLQIEHLEPGREVRWLSTDERTDTGELGHDGEWIGTHIVFRLTPEGAARTRLDFEHQGLVPQLHCYSQCSGGWQFFMESLRKYVETGSGTPYPTFLAAQAAARLSKKSAPAAKEAQ